MASFSAISSKLKRSNSFRNISIVFGGTLLAQVLPLALMPILTRLYSPTEFGDFAISVVIANFLLIFVTGRYEMAIIQVNNIANAILFFKSVLIISCLTSLFFYLVVYLINAFIFVQIPIFSNKNIIFWVVLLSFSIALYTLTQMLLNKLENYFLLSVNKVIMGALSTLIPITLYFLGYMDNALVIGLIVGYLISSITVLFFTGYSMSSVISLGRAFILFKRNKAFPLKDIPTSLLSFSSGQSPIIALPLLFSSSVAGYYFLIEKVFIAPVSLFANSIGVVFRKEAFDSLSSNGQYKKVFSKYFFVLLVFAFFIFLPFILYAPTIFSLIFGEQWSVAGEIAQILTPLFFMKFISSPLSYSFYISNKLNYNFFNQLVFFLLILLVLLSGLYFKDMMLFFYLWTVAGVIFYFLQILMSYSFSREFR